MKTVPDNVDGDVTVEHDLNVVSLVSGQVVVTGPAWLDLNGTIAGDLIVEAGASAQVFGMVSGDVRVYGFASIDGTVGGTVRREAGGELFIGSKASIAGGVAEPG